MTTETVQRNEAAERLRHWFQADGTRALLDEALATERRLTVERIRVRLLGDHSASMLHFHFEKAWYDKSTLHRILDEVVDRP